MPIKTKNTAPTDAIRRFVIGPIQLPGQFSDGSVVGIAGFKVPDDAYITALGVYARASGTSGSAPTCAVNVVRSAATIVTASVTASTIVTTTPDDPGTSVSAGDEITINLIIGSGHTFDDISVTIYCRSR